MIRGVTFFRRRKSHHIMLYFVLSTSKHCLSIHRNSTYVCTLDVLCIFNFRLFTARSPSKDALESAISDIYFNFALPSLWNLLFNFWIWCRLSWAGPLADLRSELKDSTKTLEQNQSMYCIWVIFWHLFRGT